MQQRHSNISIHSICTLALFKCLHLPKNMSVMAVHVNKHVPVRVQNTDHLFVHR